MPVDRHFLRRINKDTVRKKTNSVFAPDVNVRADIDAINRGEAVRQGQHWQVNGRRYMIEATGRAFPVDGEGVYRLTRGQYAALAAYNEYGETEAAERYLRDSWIAPDNRELGKRLHQLGKAHGRGTG